MGKFVRRFWSDEAGATAIEYGLIAALIAVVIIGAVSSAGGAIQETFEKIADNM
jgi:pilus assembly protein Flp/PilA